MDEIWKDIPDSDYSVSNLGRVASRKKGVWRVMKGNHRLDGYMCVTLGDGHGGRIAVKVHILVAEAFLGPKPTPKHEVNHIDGIRGNNYADNLEWVTRSGNQRHRYDVLKHGAVRGEAHGRAKVTEAEVREIIRRCAAGEFHRVVAADYGVARCTVGQIASGKYWGWLI